MCHGILGNLQPFKILVGRGESTSGKACMVHKLTTWTKLKVYSNMREESRYEYIERLKIGYTVNLEVE